MLPRHPVSSYSAAHLPPLSPNPRPFRSRPVYPGLASQHPRPEQRKVTPPTSKLPQAPPLPPAPKRPLGSTRRHPPPPPQHASISTRRLPTSSRKSPPPAPPLPPPAPPLPPPAPPLPPPVKQPSGPYRRPPPPPPPPNTNRPVSPMPLSKRRLDQRREIPLSRRRSYRFSHYNPRMQPGAGTYNHSPNRSRPRPFPSGRTNRALPRGELQARYQQHLLRLVNEERHRHGASPVHLDETLTACARRHNADLAFVQKQLSHFGVDGADLSKRLHRCGYTYRYASENVARGQGDPAHVVRSWMKSPGHRKNLISPRVTHMGVHVGRGVDGRLYWAQMFGIQKKEVKDM